VTTAEPSETPQTPAPIESLGFDDALAELKRTVEALEAGGQPLEEAIALHERASRLREHCEQLLSGAELRLQQLVQGAGGPQLVDVRAEDAAEG
jgi:exodeoxyribonuclease VII small subunit